MLDILNQNSGAIQGIAGAIQGIATVILVLVTIYYAIQTKRTVNQMQETRRYEFLPILEINVRTRDVNEIFITLGNIGKGVARSPQVYVPLSTESFKLPSIGPRGIQEIHVTLDSSRILDLSEDNRKLKVEYLDVFSRQIVSEALFVPEDAEESHPEKRSLTINNWKLLLPEEQSKNLFQRGLYRFNKWVIVGIICIISLFILTHMINDIYNRQNLVQTKFSDHLAQHNLIMLSKASSLKLPLKFLKASYYNYFVALNKREPSQEELDGIKTEEDYIKIIEQEDRVASINQLLDVFSLKLRIFRITEIFLFIILVLSQVFNIFTRSYTKSYKKILKSSY